MKSIKHYPTPLSYISTTSCRCNYWVQLMISWLMYSFLYVLLFSNITVNLIQVFHMTMSQCYLNQQLTVSVEDLWSIFRGENSTLWIFGDTLCLLTTLLLEPGVDIGVDIFWLKPGVEIFWLTYDPGTRTLRSFSSTSVNACFFSGSDDNKFVHW